MVGWGERPAPVLRLCSHEKMAGPFETIFPITGGRTGFEGLKCPGHGLATGERPIGRSLCQGVGSRKGYPLSSSTYYI